MAIMLSFTTKGGRNYGGSHREFVAHEIRHVKLSGDMVGLNIDTGGKGSNVSLRMEIEEARMLAEMLLEGADTAARRLATK